MHIDRIKDQADFVATLLAKLVTPDLAWVVAAATALGEYFVPDHAARVSLGAAALLTICDTLTAMVAVRIAPNLADREPISSAKLFRLIVKGFVYGMFVIVCSLASKSVPGVTAAMSGVTVSGALGVVIFRETISNLENFRKMGFDLMPAVTKHFDKNDLPQSGQEGGPS